jgi:hypothetical protein
MGMRTNLPFSSATSRNHPAQWREAPFSPLLGRASSRTAVNASSRAADRLGNLEAFLVRHDAVAKAEIEKVERHDLASGAMGGTAVSTRKSQAAISFQIQTARK